MKKIMFNDRFGLTEAVINGTKKVTRRIVTPQPTCSDMSGINWKGYAYGLSFAQNIKFVYKNFVDGTEHDKSCKRYRVNEVLAIAQRYSDIICGAMFDSWEIKELEKSAGYNNKMFVKAELMPHQIKISNVRFERLQDITDEDCINEGIEELPFGWSFIDSKIKPYGGLQSFSSPREAFAELIDRICGKGTWESNPYVWVDYFELIDRADKDTK